MDNIHSHSMTTQAASIAKGDITSREVVEAHLTRIDAVNPSVNAITRTLDETALAAADAADVAHAEGRTLGPLHGVPFTIKENIDCAGSPTTHGVPAFADVIPTADAPAVERMKAAGAIPLGRTNLSEFALRISTQNPLHGYTNNPWDPTLTAGGSSGGEAAALATGMTPFGIGNDLGGSVRNPAFCCGIAALKPTRGRIPSASSIPPQDSALAMQLMAVHGPMARTVDDLELGLSVLAGRHRRDPTSVDAPLHGPPVPRTAALVTDVPGGPIHPSARAAVERAGDALSAAGWIVEIASPPDLELVQEVWLGTLARDLVDLMSLIRGLMAEPTSTTIDTLIAAAGLDERNPRALDVERARLTRTWVEFLGRHSVIVGPGWCNPPFPHDADIDPDTGPATVLDRLRFTTPANLLGLPSLALPIGDGHTMPSGVQIYANHWREDVSITAARCIESAVPVARTIDPHPGPA